MLLDTCAAIWMAEPDEQFAAVEDELERTVDAGGTIFVSPIVAWEIGLLTARGRLALSRDPKQWFSDLLASGLTLAPITPDLLIDSSFLPQALFRDPADRIMAATARAIGCPLVTRDRLLLDYAAAGWMKAMAC